MPASIYTVNTQIMHHTYPMYPKNYYWIGLGVTKSVINPKNNLLYATRLRLLVQEILLCGVRYSFEFPYVCQNRIPGVENLSIVSISFSLIV